MALAIISASCSSQTETNRGNATSVEIEIDFGKLAKLQLKNATIDQFSGHVFQIVVNEACKLTKNMNPNLSPCIRENEGAHEREESGSIIPHDASVKQRKTPENNLPLEMHTSISAKEPDVLLQAGRDQNEGAREREESGTLVSNDDTAKQRKMLENTEMDTCISAKEPPPASRPTERRIATQAKLTATTAVMLLNTAVVVARRQLIDGPLSWGQLKTSCESIPLKSEKVLHIGNDPSCISKCPAGAFFLQQLASDDTACKYQPEEEHSDSTTKKRDLFPFGSLGQMMFATAPTAPSTALSILSAAASSTYQTSEASNSIDGTATTWQSNNGSPQWLQLTLLNSSKAVCGYSITARTNNNGLAAYDSPKAWLFEAWDGSSWNAVITESEVAPWTSGETKAFTNPETQAEMFRLYVTEVGGRINGKFYTVISGFSMYGCSDPTTAPTAAPTNIGDTHVPTAAPTAAPTISPYILAAIGTCSLPYTFIDTAATCGTAAVILAIADTSAYTTSSTWSPYGCYYRQSTGFLYFNPDGGMFDDDTDRVSLCRVAPTAAPTIAPTNFGDTNFPTASPTDSPTASPTEISWAGNWADLKATCSDGACETANGGCTITLSNDFVMQSYSGEISFSGKTITIWGQGKALDAEEAATSAGRFFSGNGADSSLELHEVILQNARADQVSGWVLASNWIFP
jgi:hypothetical protein